MAGTLHFVLNEHCLVRPTWLESRWIQWDQQVGELGCSFQRPTGSHPIRSHQPRCATFSLNVGGCFSVRLAEHTGFSEKHLAARMAAAAAASSSAVPVERSRLQAKSVLPERLCATPGSYQFSMHIIVRLP